MRGIPARLLGEGEEVVLALRPHWRTMVPPVLLLLVVSPSATFLAAMAPPGPTQPWLRLGAGLVAVLVLARWVLRPFLRWVNTAYVVTDRRLITRIGVLARLGRDLPLARVNDVTFEHRGLTQRLLRCGTLVVETAGERGQIVLRDVPRVAEVQRDLYRLVETADRRRGYVGQPREHPRDSTLWEHSTPSRW